MVIRFFEKARLAPPPLPRGGEAGFFKKAGPRILGGFSKFLELLTHISNCDDFCTKWKPRDSQGFQSVQKSSKLDICVKRYVDFESVRKIAHNPGAGFFEKGPPPPLEGGWAFSKKRISQNFSDLRLHFEIAITYIDPHNFWYMGSILMIFGADWKLRFRAFNRYKNHQNSLYASKVMAISKKILES